MTKAELIEAMATGADITKAAAALALDAYVDAVSKELKKGGKISLVGFGTFSISKRKAREGRNPKTGETLKIPAKKVVKFKPGKELADKVS
ncbi:MAG TPA: HU family DNA-binding protein [Smithellaceae bacterium]|nr:HU family DNA-binding protein [Smithellaceae bacterium]HRS89036.1 HU family DNA-binding protein [Smithellaceae bacterium]HRV25092.1 HU family DNA-binding protein [Smithellaceae bacterium]